MLLIIWRLRNLIQSSDLFITVIIENSGTHISLLTRQKWRPNRPREDGMPLDGSWRIVQSTCKELYIEGLPSDICSRNAASSIAFLAATSQQLLAGLWCFWLCCPIYIPSTIRILVPAHFTRQRKLRCGVHRLGPTMSSLVGSPP